MYGVDAVINGREENGHFCHAALLPSNSCLTNILQESSDVVHRNYSENDFSGTLITLFVFYLHFTCLYDIFALYLQSVLE
mgnify:FL=1